MQLVVYGISHDVQSLLVTQETPLKRASKNYQGEPPRADPKFNIVQLLHVLKHIQDTVAYGLETEWISAGIKTKEALIDHICNEDMSYMKFHRREKS
jgi:hypothetical protein